MEEEIVKGEKFIAVPEEKEAEQTPVEEPVQVSAEEPQVVNPEPAVEPAEVVEPVAEEPAAEPEVPAEEAPVAEEPVATVEGPVAAAEGPSAVVEGPVAEDAPAVEPEAPAEAEPAAEEPAESPSLATCADVIAQLKALPNYGVSLSREELEHLKQMFYRWHNAAVGEMKEAFVAAGNDADAFVLADRCPELVAEEEEFKTVMATIREKRAEAQKELDRIREQNLLRKEAILERLKTMIDNADTVPVSYDDFQAIQQEWREIKDVPPEKASELWKTYQSYTEKFYDIRKLNNMFRDYDFKKNLEVKTQLCEQAEKLADEPDVVVAFRQLQKLHQEFREAGPVAKDLREGLWERFKEASTVINRRYQQYFEEIKKSEKENLEQKIAICEIMEAINFDELTSYAKWNDKTQEVLALQAKWKTLGFAPKKQNQKVFDRFRAACDVFFTKKAAFFKSTKENLSVNLEKKIALCEQAEALKDSTDWKATSDKMAALQKEWRTIGAVPKKQSDAVWKRFMAACDDFFSKRNSATSSQRSEEHKNLAAKKDIVASLKELSDQLEQGVQDMGNDFSDKLRGLVADWNSIGHVPFRDKDKLYKQYRSLVDDLFDKLHVSESARRVSNFRKRVSEAGGNAVDRERERLLQTYERVKNELKTYENNLGFLSATSKSGNSLLAEMQRKMEKLKADANEILEKIKSLDKPEEPDAPAAPAEEAVIPEAPENPDVTDTQETPEAPEAAE